MHEVSKNIKDSPPKSQLLLGGGVLMSVMAHEQGDTIHIFLRRSAVVQS